MINNKKAAMEMSVGTIVTIVLLMSVLVLGMVLITNIFSGAKSSVNQIDEKVKSEINELFKKEGAKVAFSPSDRKVSLNQGSTNEGFAFSINNKDVVEKTFSYKIFVDIDLQQSCGIRATEAESWLLIKEGRVKLPRSSAMELPELVLFTIPETAPKCTIPFSIEVYDGAELYSSGKVWVTII